MGMFDEIEVKVPLPGLERPKTNWFQTKDLECLLDRYSIEDGILLKEGVPCDYHGYIVFYTSEMEKWFEYEAKFTDGKLVSIEVIKDE